MSTRIVVNQIPPPRSATADASRIRPIRMPHTWLAVTVAAAGYVIYVGGIALFSSVICVLAGISMIVLSLGFYLGAVLNAYARLPREAITTAGSPVEPVHQSIPLAQPVAGESPIPVA